MKLSYKNGSIVGGERGGREEMRGAAHVYSGIMKEDKKKVDLDNKGKEKQ